MKDPVNWKTGDIITVAPNGTTGSDVEKSTITAVASATEYTISPSLTTGWHSLGDEVMNLTRNCDENDERFGISIADYYLGVYGNQIAWGKVNQNGSL